MGIIQKTFPQERLGVVEYCAVSLRSELVLPFNVILATYLSSSKNLSTDAFLLFPNSKNSLVEPLNPFHVCQNGFSSGSSRDNQLEPTRSVYHRRR
jgi:hypothetical protein